MRKNILIVEYDNQTIDKIKDMLPYPVFELTIADAGDVAKKLLEKEKYDLVVTAAMLPKFHGFDLCKLISSDFPDTRVIVMSGVYKGIEYRNQAISEFGADDFIEKPLKDKEFINSVYTVLDISESDVQTQFDSGSTQIPTSDTKKIKIEKEKEEEKLSSNDIFGDIIDKVENEHEITIDTEEEYVNQKTGEQSTQEIDNKDRPPTVLNLKQEIKKEPKEEEIDFSTLIKPEKKLDSTDSGKIIENDISRKLEETLSGLGFESKKVKPKKKSLDRQSEQQKSENEIEGYEILGMMARGGMAEIYKAKKKGVKGFEKIIVIKKILSGYGEDDKYIEMFVDEAKIAAELTHPNIVQIYDFGKKDDFYFIAMEYVEGKDLRLILNKLLEKSAILDEYLSIHITIKILEALSYAHSATDSKGISLEIVHRDISPPNILISYSGEVKLTDFGVSKASIKSHQTLSGALKGKLLYMSPEQAKAEKNIDNRSDIYSVGIILFELLTGKKLFSGLTEMEVLKKVQAGKIIKPSEINRNIDPDLENIILRAVSAKKSNRYQNATQMIAALENYLYINYNHAPTQAHLQHKMVNLFNDEILKSGIIITQKTTPLEIEKIIPPSTVESATKQESHDSIASEESDKTIELVQENEIKYPSDSFGVTEEELHMEASSAISKPIDLQRETISIEPDSDNISQDFEIPMDKFPLSNPNLKKRKKTSPFLKIMLLLTLLVFSAYYFFIREGSVLSSANVQKENSEKKVVATSKDVSPPVNKILFNNKSEVDDILNSPSKKIDDSLLNGDQTGKVSGDQNTVNPAEKTKNDEEELNRKKEEEDKKNKLLKKQKAEERKRIQDEKRRKKIEADKKKEEDRIALEIEKKKEEDRIALEIEKKKEEDRIALELKKKKEEEERNRIKPGQLVALKEVDVKPVPIYSPTPKLNRSMKLRQSVIALALIDHSGNVEKVKMLKKSRNKKIDSAIIQTILLWKYKPAIKDGVKVKVWKTINLK